MVIQVLDLVRKMMAKVVGLVWTDKDGRRAENIQFFFQLRGLWEGVIQLPPPPPRGEGARANLRLCGSGYSPQVVIDAIADESTHA